MIMIKIMVFMKMAGDSAGLINHEVKTDDQEYDHDDDVYDNNDQQHDHDHDHDDFNDGWGQCWPGQPWGD